MFIFLNMHINYDIYIFIHVCDMELVRSRNSSVDSSTFELTSCCRSICSYCFNDHVTMSAAGSGQEATSSRQHPERPRQLEWPAPPCRCPEGGRNCRKQAPHQGALQLPPSFPAVQPWPGSPARDPRPSRSRKLHGLLACETAEAHK